MKGYLNKTVESYYPGKPKYIGKLDFNHRKKIDSKTVEKISKFIRKNTIEPDYWAGAVVGISDGLDGATSTALCIKALGNKKVIGVIVRLGGKETHIIQEKLAVKTARTLGVEYIVIDASKVYKESQNLVNARGPFTDVNISTRVIQDIIFQIADEKNYAVISTINKSEILTGRLSENFYGHIAPLAGLYKTEIFDLARVLKIPKEIIARKPGGVDTWYDEDTFGVTYDTLDKMLYLLTEKNLSPKEITKKYNFDQEWLEKLQTRTVQRYWRLATKELHFK